MDRINDNDRGQVVLIVVVILLLLGLATWAGSCLGASRVRKQLESVQTDLAQAQSVSATSQKDNALLRTQLASAQNDLAQALTASATFQKDNTLLRTQLASAQNDLAQARTASATFQQDITSLRTQLTSTQTEVSQIKSQYGSLQDNNTSLRTQLAAAQSQLSQVQSMQNTLQQQNATLQTQLASSQAQISQVQSLQNTIQTLQQENATLKAQLASGYTGLSSSITLSPGSGPVGTTMTVAGSGFAANTSGIVFLDVNRNGSYDAGEPIQYLMTAANGTFSTTVTVPSSAATGAYPVLHTFPLAQTSSQFTVTTTTATSGPVITLSPTSGPVGTTITINGYGFVANTSGLVFFDTNRNGNNNAGEPIQYLMTTANGTFSTTLIVPAAAPGTYPVLAGFVTAGASENFTIIQQ